MEPIEGSEKSAYNYQTSGKQPKEYIIGLYLVSFGCFMSIYSKLIGWVIEGNKYATTGGDQAFLMVVP